MTLIIGLTGGIASGKTTAASYFSKKGIEIANADLMAKKCVQKGSVTFNKIVEYFGQEIITEQNDLNRKKLRNIIFKDIKKKKWLENLLHPKIKILIEDHLQLATSPYAILESPLLLETDQHKMVDRILVIDTKEQNQIQRAIERDNCTINIVNKIMSSQISKNDRLQKADDIIVNDSNKKTFFLRLDKMHEKYLSLSK